MDFLIWIGGIVLALIAIVLLFRVVLVLGVVAFIAYVISRLTGLPLWGSIVIVVVVGLIAWLNSDL